MLNEMFDWCVNNWDSIVQAILMLIGLASIIVKWTPTPKDDAWLGKIKNFISQFIALNPKK